MKFTFRGHRIDSRFDSSRRDKHDGTHTNYFCTHQNEKLFAVKKRSKTVFFTSVTSAGQTVDLGSTLITTCDVEFNSLSNAVFGFTLAPTVPEIMEVFRRDAR